ncbi:hypothetical protein [Achromobacter sp. MFA1 R4]|uniref:hypothetical protein n=1 Tax=Achromobacter sp. MFA1 R4 TaxID=1881016 RepID=UPI0009539856|nr:hypothetical protein [Achromobacter sp. MFA1 R4]SIS99814.1 hypothetical protein SAMN05428937_0003 [Achromobacter sp. MFA1 R4]
MTENLNADDLVQLDPGKVGNPLFAGCVMVVTEPKSWGAQGYVQAPGGGQAYYRQSMKKWNWLAAPFG